jgi:hypothetical protein
MKTKIRVGIALLSLFMSNQAISCDIENIFNGELELNITYDKEYGYESAIIKQWGTGEKKGISTIRGEIDPAKAGSWDIRDTESTVIGYITKDLVVTDMDDDCNKTKIKLKKITKNKYQIINGKVSIGEIQSRLPKEY